MCFVWLQRVDPKTRWSEVRTSYLDRCFNLLGEMEPGAKRMWHTVEVDIVLMPERRGAGLEELHRGRGFWPTPSQCWRRTFQVEETAWGRFGALCKELLHGAESLKSTATIVVVFIWQRERERERERENEWEEKCRRRQRENLKQLPYSA